MRFPITRRAKLPTPPQPPPEPQTVGLGDIVEKVANPIKNTLLKIKSPRLQRYLSSCKCKERKEWLNKHFPFK